MSLQESSERARQHLAWRAARQRIAANARVESPVVSPAVLKPIEPPKVPKVIAFPAAPPSLMPSPGSLRIVRLADEPQMDMPPAPRLLPVPKYPPMKLIIQHVADRYGISVMELMSERRTANIVMPRQMAMYLAKILTPRSFPHIGKNMGNRDHTTVLHAHRKIARLCKTDADVAAEIAILRTKIMEVEAA